MINWIKGLFEKITEQKTSSPKCGVCGLGAVFELHITMYLLETEEEDKTSIKTLICETCKDNVNEIYNPMWLPPFIIKEA